MTHGAQRAVPGEPAGSPARPRCREEARQGSSAPARETLGFIHALASEWEDDRSRPHRPQGAGPLPSE